VPDINLLYLVECCLVAGSGSGLDLVSGW